MAKLLRRKSQLVVAFGACAHLGGIPGLANLCGPESILEYVYREAPTTDEPRRPSPRADGQVPEGELTLPEFYETVRTLDQVVEVDYYLPGCPPTPKMIADAVEALLSGELPPKGAVLAPATRALCYECPLQRHASPRSC